MQVRRFELAEYVQITHVKLRATHEQTTGDPKPTIFVPSNAYHAIDINRLKRQAFSSSRSGNFGLVYEP